MKNLRIAGIILLVIPFVTGCDRPQEQQSERQVSEEQTSVPSPAKKPNILIIVADDMGYSDIGAFGGEVNTPTLDSLANDALRLSNFHVLPSCSPTRSVLLSGLDNHLAGIGKIGEFNTPEMQTSM